MSSSIFKSYDIRGLAPQELSPQIAFKIGVAIATHFPVSRVVISRDQRETSLPLRDALVRGLSLKGVHVTDIGVSDTPMLYFASAKLPVDAGIMITASHNPPEYNGIKICLKHAIPVGLDTGLKEIRDIALSLSDIDNGITPKVRETDITGAYFSFLSSFVDLGQKRFRIVTDTANAMGVKELPLFHKMKNIVHVGALHTSLGFPCPHEANPLKTETLIELQHAVRSTKADIGIAYDGDADRVGLVDEKGHVVTADIILALLSRVTLEEHPGATIFYDLRSSNTVRDEIIKNGGIAKECRVGHAHIKRAMKQGGAVLAGELAGHFYFNEGGYIAEMGSLPALLIMNLMARTGQTLSSLVSEVSRYYHSGELNFSVRNAEHLLAKAELTYASGKLSKLDGVKIVFDDWWFSLRASNTEPLVRLNVEATTKELLEEKKNALVAMIEEA